MDAALPEELPDDLASLWQFTRRVGALMDRRSEAICRERLGISFAQFLVLSVVDAHPGNLSQQAVADRLGLTKGTVSRQIDAAVSAGLMTVRVAQHSRRENTLALTDAGTKLVRKGDAVLEPSRQATLGSITTADIQTTVKTLRTISDLLKEKSEPAR